MAYKKTGVLSLFCGIFISLPMYLDQGMVILVVVSFLLYLILSFLNRRLSSHAFDERDKLKKIQPLSSFILAFHLLILIKSLHFP